MKCNELQEVVKSKATLLASQLQDKAATLAAEIQEAAKGIDPNINTTGVDAWIGLDIDISWKETKFSVDLPEVRMINQTWSLDLPEVTITNKDIIFHTPSTRMVTVSGPNVPEVFCRMETKDIGFGIKIDVPVCVTEMKPTYIDVPEVFMEEQRIVLGIPEFKMSRMEFVIGIPEFFMKAQEFSLHLPQITVKNIKEEAKKAKEKGEELAEDAKIRSEKLKAVYREEVKLSLSQDIKRMFSCYEQSLNNEKQSTLKKFDDNIRMLNSIIASMVANKVPDDNESLMKMKASLLNMMAQKEKYVATVTKMIKDFYVRQEACINQLIAG